MVNYGENYPKLSKQDFRMVLKTDKQVMDYEDWKEKPHDEETGLGLVIALVFSVFMWFLLVAGVNAIIHMVRGA